MAVMVNLAAVLSSVSEHLRRADVRGGSEQGQHAEFGQNRFPAAAEADELMQRVHRPTGRDAVSDNLQRRRNNFQRPPASAERRHDRACQHAKADDLVLVLHHRADPHAERSRHPRVKAERKENSEQVVTQVDLEDELSEPKA